MVFFQSFKGYIENSSIEFHNLTNFEERDFELIVVIKLKSLKLFSRAFNYTFQEKYVSSIEILREIKC
jgi:hypothetical protein